MTHKLMIRFETGNGEWLAVDVPNGAHGFQLYPKSSTNHQPMIDYWKHEGSAASGDIELTDGDYTIIGIAGELSEEQKVMIIDTVQQGNAGSLSSKTIAGYYHYLTGGTTYELSDAWGSLCSLHNITSTALILKINK